MLRVSERFTLFGASRLLMMTLIFVLLWLSRVHIETVSLFLCFTSVYR